MHDQVASLVTFLLILNPFALCLYLSGVMDDIDRRSMFSMLVTASGVSFGVFLIFAWAGEPFLVEVMGVRPEALRIFGGVVFFHIAYLYVMRGYRGTEMLRGEIDELASQIALPFMIGAGTITQAIILGKRHDFGSAAGILAVGMVVSVVMVVLFQMLRETLRTRHERAFRRYINMGVRINGLFIGAISVEMIISGLRPLWGQAAERIVAGA